MHSLTEMGFSEVNPGILGPVWPSFGPVRDWSDRIEPSWIGTGRSRLGLVGPDWDWSVWSGTGFGPNIVLAAKSRDSKNVPRINIIVLYFQIYI